MNDRNREYEERVEKRAVQQPKRRLPQSRGSVLSRPVSQQRKRKAATKKRQARRLQLTVAGTAILAVLIIVIVVICQSCGAGNKKFAALEGKWRYDDYTEYEFDGKENGCLCLDGSTHYVFTYSVSGKTLKLDFVQQYVTDCEYTFTIEKEKLILVGGKGTAERGKTYELIRETSE